MTHFSESIAGKGYKDNKLFREQMKICKESKARMINASMFSVCNIT